MRHSRLKIQTSSNKYSIYIGTNISDKIKTILNNEKIFFNTEDYENEKKSSFNRYDGIRKIDNWQYNI